MSKIIFIDMDGVLVDFSYQLQKYLNDSTIPDSLNDSPEDIEGFFLDPPPIRGAIECVTKLSQSNKFDLYIATSAPWNNPSSLTDKRIWIENYFGDLFKKKLITTHRKDLLVGDILIDDRPNNGAKDFNGEWIQFGSKKYPNWEVICDYLL